MSRPNEVIAGTVNLDTEIELSAVELHALSSVRSFQNGKPDHAARLPHTPPKSLGLLSQDSTAGRHGHAAIRWKALSRATIGLVLAAVPAAGAFYTYSATREADQRVAPAIAIVQTAQQREWLLPDPEPLGSPVRFTNPFDATEVFEFPPGTSQDEARNAVAKMLLDRARERRALP